VNAIVMPVIGGTALTDAPGGRIVAELNADESFQLPRLGG